MSPLNAGEYLRRLAGEVEAELARVLSGTGPAPVLRDAMRYAALGGGKRIRPVLTLASAECLGAPSSLALPAACALELIHNYSLVHDDLPAMDNDAMRRGRPTVHRAYGEAEGVLAGDALLTLAFEHVSAGSLAAAVTPERVVAMTRELAVAAGVAGMCGGQALEIESVGGEIDLAAVREISELKTGALFRAACRLGAIAGGADEAALAALTRFGAAIGLAFQIIDDLLDESQDEVREGLPTFVSLLGSAGAHELAVSTAAEARAALEPFGDAAAMLLGILDLMSARQE